MENSIFLGQLHTLLTARRYVSTMLYWIVSSKYRKGTHAHWCSFEYIFFLCTRQSLCFILLLFDFYPRVINLYYIECGCIDKFHIEKHKFHYTLFRLLLCTILSCSKCMCAHEICLIENRNFIPLEACQARSYFYLQYSMKLL